jgi:hypothetical protein
MPSIDERLPKVYEGLRELARRRLRDELASKVMRHVLVDPARRRSADERGGGRTSITLDPDRHAIVPRLPEFHAVNDALDQLAALDPRRVQLVEYRLFGGLSAPETAEAPGTSLRTVERDWMRARAYRLLNDTEDDICAPVTRTGHLHATSRYASPEQLRHEAVTTATDDYQLGVLLDEVLDGVHPMAAIDPSVEAMTRALHGALRGHGSPATHESRGR